MSPRPLPESFGGPSPRSRCTLPSWVPAGHADLLGAVERRHLDGAAGDRLDDRDRNVDLEVVALALEDRRRRDVRDDVEVAGAARRRGPARPCPRAGCGCPRARRPGPSRGSAWSAACGRCRGRSGTDPRSPLPRPPHSEQGCDDREHALALRLDAAALAAADRSWGSSRAWRPTPWQVGQSPSIGTLTEISVPSIACANDSRTSVSRSRPRWRRSAPPGPPPRPNRSERMSPNEPTFAAERRGVEAKPPPPPNMPPASYCLRFSGSDRTEYASWISLKRSSAFVVAGVRVGVVLARKLAVGLLDLVLGGPLLDAERLVEVRHLRLLCRLPPRRARAAAPAPFSR